MGNIKEMYQELVKAGLTPKDAAKQVQAKTGLSAVSGRPITKKVGFTKGRTVYGQYGIPKG